jgi:hypothetical protein
MPLADVSADAPRQSDVSLSQRLVWCQVSVLKHELGRMAVNTDPASLIESTQLLVTGYHGLRSEALKQVGVRTARRHAAGELDKVGAPLEQSVDWSWLFAGGRRPPPLHHLPKNDRCMVINVSVVCAQAAGGTGL